MNTTTTHSSDPATEPATAEAPSPTPAPEPSPEPQPELSPSEQPALSTWERIEASADRLEDRLEEVVRDQRARRIVVRDDGRIVADFPLAVGVVGAVLAAPVAAIAAIVALLSDCTIEVEHVMPDGPTTTAAATSVSAT